MADNRHRKTVTQDDVAERAGVSRAMVSYVINNGPRQVAEETRNRVLAAIKELGYRPNKHAQMLSGNDFAVGGKYIGIIMAGHYMFRRPYYGAILASIHAYAHERDRHIRFIRVFDDFNNPALFNELIDPNEIGGVILIGLDQVLQATADSALIQQIVDRVERVVCVEWTWPGVPTIRFDRQDAALQATRHLIGTGRAHIAYIGPEDQRDVGYRQALWEVGVPVDTQLVHYAIDAASGFESVNQLLDSGLEVDAIFTGTDEVAVGVLNGLHRRDITIPGQIALASIDNLDIAAFTIPALTTMDVPKNEIGQHAVEILLADTARRGASAFSITVPTRLIVRESSQ
ncbi:MAG: LacI family DNA-binding transcriptional regulator [Anaerolineae bacterium]|nr:LacI family DNA-binding transcriptional regulator [Chloroflexota bacterium]MBP6298049.1 LacI family DNA-binding transcriptional regulator [Anaerolineae bacterium]